VIDWGKTQTHPEEVAVQVGEVIGESALPFQAQDAMRWALRRGFPELYPEAAPTQASIYGVPLGLPTRKGATLTRLEDAWEQADLDNMGDEIKQQILNVADQNHISRRSVIQGVIARHKKRQRTATGHSVQYTRGGEEVGR
jgi:hypothetical protein